MNISYYWWAGVGAIEDLENVASDKDAMQAFAEAMAAAPDVDGTLWRRIGLTAQLMAVRPAAYREINRWIFNEERNLYVIQK